MAAARAIPREERTSIHLYVDEADAYMDAQTPELFRKMRSYGLGAMFAFQDTLGMKENLRPIMGSTSIKIAAGLEYLDAAALAPNMRTTTSFLLSHEKPPPAPPIPSEVKFAVYVDSVTKRAATVRTPTLLVESRAMTAEQFESAKEAWAELLRPDRHMQPDSAEQMAEAVEYSDQVEPELPTAEEPQVPTPEDPLSAPPPVIPPHKRARAARRQALRKQSPDHDPADASDQP